MENQNKIISKEDLLVDNESINELLALSLTPTEMAKQLQNWGDHRSLKTIARSIQRMMSGETSVSGEMKVIISFFRLQQYQDVKRYSELIWQKHANDGSYSTVIDDFTLRLYPKSLGRWHSTIIHTSGYSHPWPNWQSDLEAGKKIAIRCFNDAKRHIIEYEMDIFNFNLDGNLYE